jgi:hypothetical protein
MQSMNVRCAHCGRIYNLKDCKDVNTQYRDVTIWTAPCCGMRVDDEYYYGLTRGRKHYTEVSDTEMQMLEQGMGIFPTLPLHMRRRQY